LGRLLDTPELPKTFFNLALLRVFQRGIVAGAQLNQPFLHAPSGFLTQKQAPVWISFPHCIFKETPPGFRHIVHTVFLDDAFIGLEAASYNF
jgi:hypothetical protein